MARTRPEITVEMKDLLRKSGSMNRREALTAQAELAKALELPLRQGVLKGDITGDIFSPIYFEPGAAIEFPLDFLAPGTEKDHFAYVIPNHGTIPQRAIEGEFLQVPVYDVANAIDWLLKYARDARWDVVRRAMEVFEAGFVRRDNVDAWKVLISVLYTRNIVVYDDAATAGLFTKRLIALSKTQMRRNAGGNSTSINQGRLTDVYISPESVEDIRSWDLTLVDDFTRREILVADDTSELGELSLTRIFGVNIHDLDELGVGQDFQGYFINTLGGSLPGSKLELAVGLDLRNDDAFVHPIRAELEIFEDETLHRSRKAGIYGWKEAGWACVDSRRVIGMAV